MTHTHDFDTLSQHQKRKELQYCRRYIVAALGLVAVLGCHQLTDIDAPDLVDPAALDNATGASARYAGAISGFAAAYSEQVAETGLIADELQDVGDNPLSPDRRVIPSTNDYPFAALSRARLSAFRAIATLQQFAPTPPQRIGELYALVGYVEAMFAENLCTPVPLATVTDGVPTVAPAYTRDSLLVHALAMFDSAAENAGTSDTVVNLARMGRARVLLLRGDVPAAAAAVAGVPLGFEYRVPYSGNTSGQTNTVYNRIAVGRYVSVSDREGTNGLPFVSSADPRVGAQSLGLSRAGLPLYNFTKDAGLGAPIVLASGVEASLIRAEAALAQGDITAWADTLNALRQAAITPPLPPLSDDSTITASADLRIDVLFQERAFWLFGTGHRQGDLRRLIRQYGRSPDGTFPSGNYAPTPGVQYGPDITFVPSGEEPNTAYHGCTERGA